MSQKIAIVDRGRGLQLSTSRITVQDLVPFFQRGCTLEEIQRWMPTLSPEEIAVVERYYQEHRAALDAQDQRIRQRTAERIQEQQQRFPQFNGTREERLARLRQALEKKRQERNGERHSG
jgi:uncharacterized protein (DUF433 family)